MLSSGETLAQYKILEPLGCGGMGEVYKAQDLRLGRLAAIKILPAKQSENTSRRRRFLREARAASALNHPGIVTVYEIFPSAGRDVLAMELVEGRALNNLIPEEGMEPGTAAQILRQLAEAVAAAHAAGVVHRDLKPSNVMVGPAGQVKVLDFGVAKLAPMLEEETLTNTALPLTKEGTAPGTAAYMSPEQVLGEPVGARSDIFALGIVSYEMLTGRRPFHGTNLALLTHQIVFAEPVPVEELRPEISQDLARLVRRALEKQPEKRYPNMAALLEDLPATSSPAARPAPSPTSASGTRPAAKPPPRWPRRALAAAALVLVLALGQFFRNLPTGGGAETAEAEGATGVGEISPYALYREGLEFLARYDREGALEEAIARFDQAVQQAEDYAPAHSGLARAYWRQYRLKRDPIWLDRARDSAGRAILLDSQLIHARVGQALISTSFGAYEEARETLVELRRLDPANADIHRGLADLELLEGRLEAAAAAYTRAIEYGPGDWELHSQLGLVYLKQSDFDAAEAAFQASIERAPDSAYPRRNLAAVYHYQGRYAEAARELQKSIEIRPTAAAYSNLGTLYFFEGLYQQAAEALEQARQLGANDYIFWANLGDVYRQIPGRREESRESFERAVQLLDKELLARPADPELRSRLALYRAKKGEAEAARAGLHDLEPLDGRTPSTVYRVALVHELTASRDRALEVLALALEAGYPLSEVEKEPDLVALREDVRFHRLVLKQARRSDI